MQKLILIIKTSLTILSIGLCISSCSQQQEEAQPIQESSRVPINFRVSLNGNWSDGASRGTMVEQFATSFGLYASYYDAGSEDTQTMNYLQNEKAGEHSGEFRTENSFAAPPLHKELHLYVYYPYEATGATQKHTTFNASGQGAPQFTYSLIDDVEQQADLMAADTIASTNDVLLQHVIPLRFSHLLTAVRFRVDASVPACTIKKISIKNVADGGTYDYAQRAWTQVNTTLSTYDINPNLAIVGGEKVSLQDSYTFMMMPQTLGEDAQVEITYNTGSVDKKVSASLKDRMWESGKIVSYNIKFSDDNLSTQLILTATVSDWTSVTGHYTF